jgi:hypothetical protein
MHNSFVILYIYYIKFLDMFREILCSFSGLKTVFLQHLVSNFSKRVEEFNVIHILYNKGIVHQVGN